MSVFKTCPHNNQECIHEIYAGEPNYKCCKKCSVYTSINHFTKYCKPVVLADDWKDDNRPSKDEYYLGFAKAAAIRGTCLRRNYGAVIVKNDEIVSTGYTGAPRGRYNCNEIGRCVRMEKGIPSGQRYEMCRSVHAEMNAIISASRDKMIGATLYLYGWDVEHNCEKTDPVPCSLCERMIINAGIEEVVALNPLYTEGGKEPKIKHYKVKDYVECDESLQYLIETAKNEKEKPRNFAKEAHDKMLSTMAETIDNNMASEIEKDKQYFNSMKCFKCKYFYDLPHYIEKDNFSHSFKTSKQNLKSGTGILHRTNCLKRKELLEELRKNRFEDIARFTYKKFNGDNYDLISWKLVPAEHKRCPYFELDENMTYEKFIEMYGELV